MSDSLDWGMLNKFFVYLSETLLPTASEPLKIGIHSKTESTSEISLTDTNPLLIFPFSIRENITSEFYEAGMSSMAQQYIEATYCCSNKNNELQKIFNDIYFYAVKKNKHTLAYNIIVILSQIPYKYLGKWASTLAMAATRNRYIDVIELGVRCFENWESKDACDFLKQCSFSETWLQKYADEVCEYVEKEGIIDNVLLEKNYAWKMASGVSDSTSNIAGYSSRYGSIGV